MGVVKLGAGAKQWLFQRTSNALFVLFGVFLVVVLASDMSFEALRASLDKPLVKIYLLVTLLFATGNAILAGWQITGDYAKKFHINANLMMSVCVAVTLAYLIFGLIIIL